jgi:signal transduction histidine kinase
VSLRRQFLVAFVAFAAVVVATVGLSAWRLTSGALEDEMDRRLEAVAGAFTAGALQAQDLLTISPGDEGNDQTLWWPNYHRLVGLTQWVDAAYVFRSNNTVLVSTEGTSLRVGTRLRWLEGYRAELQRAWLEGSATTPQFLGEDGRLYKYGFVRVENADVMLGVLIQAEFLEPMIRLQRTLLAAGLVAILVAVVLAGVLAGNVALPIERLSRVAIRIQRGRMTEPVATEQGKELGRLSRAMERMRRGILRRDEQLRLMLAQVAHEIRNPLGGLELFTSAASDTPDPDERRRLLDRVRAEIRDLNDIIDDFLAFARPLEPGPELHDVREAIHEAGDLVEIELAQRDGTMEVLLPEEPLLAQADPEHVKRIVLNLVRNAAEAGTRVQVEATAVRGEVVVAVRDDGPGVPEDLREKIFEPFVSQKEKGAGLGLAIVERVAMANGGRVELMPRDETNVGWGAEFRVYFNGSEELPIVEASPVGA